jgi:hypothetical protein
VVCLVILASLVHLARLVHQAYQVRLAGVVQRVRGAQMVSLVCLARMGRMVHSVLLEIQASLARMASLA